MGINLVVYKRDPAKVRPDHSLGSFDSEPVSERGGWWDSYRHVGDDEFWTYFYEHGECVIDGDRAPSFMDDRYRFWRLTDHEAARRWVRENLPDNQSRFLDLIDHFEADPNLYLDAIL